MGSIIIKLHGRRTFRGSRQRVLYSVRGTGTDSQNCFRRVDMEAHQHARHYLLSEATLWFPLLPCSWQTSYIIRADGRIVHRWNGILMSPAFLACQCAGLLQWARRNGFAQPLRTAPADGQILNHTGILKTPSSWLCGHRYATQHDLQGNAYLHWYSWWNCRKRWTHSATREIKPWKVAAACTWDISSVRSGDPCNLGRAAHWTRPTENCPVNPTARAAMTVRCRLRRLTLSFHPGDRVATLPERRDIKESRRRFKHQAMPKTDIQARENHVVTFSHTSRSPCLSDSIMTFINILSHQPRGRNPCNPY